MRTCNVNVFFPVHNTERRSIIIQLSFIPEFHFNDIEFKIYRSHLNSTRAEVHLDDDRETDREHDDAWRGGGVDAAGLRDLASRQICCLVRRHCAPVPEWEQDYKHRSHTSRKTHWPCGTIGAEPA